MSDTLRREQDGADLPRQADEEDAMRDPGRERTGLIGWERDTGRRNAPGWLSLDE